jgi:ribosomal protein S18 acetylase RimI-like enzyme
MIRSAKIDDAGRIAEIIVGSWRFAYKYFLSEVELYINLNIEDRIQTVKKWINNNPEYVYIFEDDNNKVIKGMMAINNCMDEDKIDSYEMCVLYTDPIFSRNGIGSKMIEYFERKGEELGKNDFVIWVLEENSIGLRFYEKMGYKSDDKRKIFPRINRTEIRYVKSKH